MNAGDGETSYAKNSGYQKIVMSKTFPVLDETIKDMLNDHVGFPKSFKMVDFGCSSGPNSLLAVSHIINSIEDLCKEKNITNNDLPEFEVFLNDLPSNDFNNLFKLLPKEIEEKKGRYFLYGLPGSFYDILLPKKSIHFAYSSYSIHWLSHIPEGLAKNNKTNIYMTMESPPEVYEAYANQYQRDFSRFLSYRAEEILPGGRLVLTFIGRSVKDPSTKDEFPVFRLLGKTLADMITEVAGKMDDLYSFNVPFYAPCIQEVETAIQAEESFTLDKIHIFRVRMDVNDKDTDDVEDEQENPLFFNNYRRGKVVANHVRPFMEPMLASHFGSSIIDDLFARYANKFAEHLRTEKLEHLNIVISLSRK
ncbi:class I SAM-dependent methyltransferase [Acinetobacter baumannii]